MGGHTAGSGEGARAAAATAKLIPGDTEPPRRSMIWWDPDIGEQRSKGLSSHGGDGVGLNGSSKGEVEARSAGCTRRTVEVTGWRRAWLAEGPSQGTRPEEVQINAVNHG